MSLPERSCLDVVPPAITQSAGEPPKRGHSQTHNFRYTTKNIGKATTHLVKWHFKYDESASKEFLAHLERSGFIKLVWDDFFHDERYVTTHDGNRIALASAAKPVTRATADRVVSEMIKRAEEINQSSSYLYWVNEIYVFGSYLSGAQRLSDVDVVPVTEHRVSDPEDRSDADYEYTMQARMMGLSVTRGFLAYRRYPYERVIRRLKNRSRTLSMHGVEDMSAEGIEFKRIYKRLPD